MKSKTLLLHHSELNFLSNERMCTTAHVALVFAPRKNLEASSILNAIKNHIQAPCLFVSTAGQISGLSVNDDAISFTFIALERSELALCTKNLSDFSSDRSLGSAIYDELYRPDLAGLMIFSDGTSINGSELKEGLEANNHLRIPITGGLAGDGADFDKTLVGIDEVRQGNVSAIAFYGDHIQMAHGSRGGWIKDGELNMVSSSSGNVLKEIEGIPALEFYKRKLNGNLKNLPADALKYPLSINDPLTGQDLVRTVLNVDEVNQSMTFAGDIPLLSNVQILSATYSNLIQGAKAAATLPSNQLKMPKPELALLISCIGRKLILEEKTVDEVIAVQEQLNANTVAGFYSYGELSPSDVSGRCELHNQTMTITTISEL